LKYKNGRSFKLRAFFIVISTYPLVVLYNKGYVLLDRYDNTLSFSKSIISLKKLKNYLQK